jgi:hypothetical protein
LKNILAKTVFCLRLEDTALHAAAGFERRNIEQLAAGQARSLAVE